MICSNWIWTETRIIFPALSNFHFLRVFGKSLRNNAPPTILSSLPPGIASNITNANHFSTPPKLVHQPPYSRWHTTNGLSPVIMNQVFNSQENERNHLRSGIHLDSRSMHTAHFGTDTISTLGNKMWKLIPDKVKHASTLSAFKAKIKSWTVNNCPCKLWKSNCYESWFCWSLYESLMESTLVHKVFFLKKWEKNFQKKLRALRFFTQLEL